MLVWKAQSQFQQQNSVKLPVIEDLCGPNLRWRVNVYFLVYPFCISLCRIMIITTLLWATSPNIVYCAYRRVHRCQNRRTLVRSSQKQSQLRPDKNQSSAQRPVWTSGQWTSLGCSDIGFPVTALGGKRRPGLIVVPAPVCRSAVWCYMGVCTVNHATKPPLPSVIIVWFSGCSYSNVGLFFSSPELELHSVWCWC